MKQRFFIATDGGSRGNPGPAAFGYVISREKGEVINKTGEAIGITTNNIAEYQAVIAALKKLKALVGGANAKKAAVDVEMDSELITRQMNRQYKIKDQKLIPLFVEVWNLSQDFDSVTFRHVPRSENREADRLVNEALDRTQDGLDV